MGKTIKSLKRQTTELDIIVVENGSTDGSYEYIVNCFPNVIVLKNIKNLGFAGGVNVGIKYCLENSYEFIALLNNDASAEKKWLEQALEPMEKDDSIGIVTSKILSKNGRTIDSTGIAYTTWGLPYPINNDASAEKNQQTSCFVFAASGGACVFRSKVFLEIGLFDEDFFAYYEDVDISFRAQLSGYRVWYESTSLVYHATGSTSSRYKGFTTYQTLKNLPWLFWKNAPRNKYYQCCLNFS